MTYIGKSCKTNIYRNLGERDWQLEDSICRAAAAIRPHWARVCRREQLLTPQVGIRRSIGFHAGVQLP